MGTSALRATLLGSIWASILVALAIVCGKLIAGPKGQPTLRRQKVSIASFVFPKALDGVTSVSLVDLTLQAALDSPRYEAILPNDHLAALLRKSRLDLPAGKLPQDIDKEKLDAQFLLLPSASRAGKTTVLTATLVNLSRPQVVNTFSVKAVGEPETTFGLVGKFWQEVDTPCTGSFRVVADGKVWDLLSSRAVVYDSRSSILQRAQKIKPEVKKAEVVHQLVGSRLLKRELRFDHDNKAILESWDHDGTVQEHIPPFQASSDNNIYGKTWKYMFANTNVKVSGEFYLFLQDRYGRSKRFDLEKVT